MSVWLIAIIAGPVLAHAYYVWDRDWKNEPNMATDVYCMIGTVLGSALSVGPYIALGLVLGHFIGKYW